MKITEIQKGKGKLYEITLEDESRLWLHADLLQNEFLHTGDDLTQERIAELKQRAAEHRARGDATFCPHEGGALPAAERR